MSNNSFKHFYDVFCFGWIGLSWHSVENLITIFFFFCSRFLCSMSWQERWKRCCWWRCSRSLQSMKVISSYGQTPLGPATRDNSEIKMLIGTRCKSEDSAVQKFRLKYSTRYWFRCWNRILYVILPSNVARWVYIPYCALTFRYIIKIHKINVSWNINSRFTRKRLPTVDDDVVDGFVRRFFNQSHRSNRFFGFSTAHIVHRVELLITQ